jgi:hypothetical protein
MGMVSVERCLTIIFAKYFHAVIYFFRVKGGDGLWADPIGKKGDYCSEGWTGIS